MTTIYAPKAGHRAGHRLYSFPNGFGASVIDDGYGREDGLYELGVLNSEGNLTYSTPITSDVLGWLTEEQVQETLGKIAALSPEDIRAEEIRRLLEESDRLRAEAQKLIDKAAALDEQARLGTQP